MVVKMQCSVGVITGLNKLGISLSSQGGGEVKQVGQNYVVPLLDP